MSRASDTINVPKGKISRSGLREVFKLYEYIRPYRWQYLLGMFFLTGASLASLAFPKLLGDLVNIGTREQTNATLNQTALLLLGILVVQAVFAFFRTVLFVNVTEKALASLRLSTYRHLIKLPVQFFEKRRVGELNSRISADVVLLQDTLTSTLAEFIRQIIVITGGITLLAITSWKLTLFMLAVLPPMMLVTRLFGRYIRKFSKDVQSELAGSNTIVEETLQGIQSVKAFTNELLEIGRYRKKTDELARLGMTRGRYRGFFSAFIILGIFGAITLVVWRGAILLQADKMNPGELFSFVIYSVFVGGTIGGLANVFANIQKFIGATEDLFKIFNEQTESIVEDPGNEISVQLTGTIEARKLSFAYPSRPKQKVLKNIDLNIQPNKMVAVVGPSGSGKTTLASLLLMLHYPPRDCLFFDGKDCHDIPLSDLRSQISLVPQDVFLFGGTIRENIAYGRPDASEEEILEAARKANAMEFIEQFPEQFDTVVGERGTQLSGGQRQRVAIARAVLKDPRILILDEATSSLDAGSEKLVQNALEKLMHGRTSIVIAHRLSTIRKADEIVVLENGEIKEKGNHEELLELEAGKYKDLIALQYAN